MGFLSVLLLLITRRKSSISTSCVRSRRIPYFILKLPRMWPKSMWNSWMRMIVNLTAEYSSTTYLTPFVDHDVVGMSIGDTQHIGHNAIACTRTCEEINSSFQSRREEKRALAIDGWVQSSRTDFSGPGLFFAIHRYNVLGSNWNCPLSPPSFWIFMIVLAFFTTSINPEQYPVAKHPYGNRLGTKKNGRDGFHVVSPLYNTSNQVHRLSKWCRSSGWTAMPTCLVGDLSSGREDRSLCQTLVTVRSPTIAMLEDEIKGGKVMFSKIGSIRPT